MIANDAALDAAERTVASQNWSLMHSTAAEMERAARSIHIEMMDPANDATPDD